MSGGVELWTRITLNPAQPRASSNNLVLASFDVKRPAVLVGILELVGHLFEAGRTQGARTGRVFVALPGQMTVRADCAAASSLVEAHEPAEEPPHRRLHLEGVNGRIRRLVLLRKTKIGARP